MSRRTASFKGEFVPNSQKVHRTSKKRRRKIRKFMIQHHIVQDEEYDTV